MVDAVVFDIGGVLIDWDPARPYRDLLPDADAVERFLSEVCTREWNARQDAGRPIAEAERELIAVHPGRADLIRAYYGRFDQAIALRSETAQLARELLERPPEGSGESGFGESSFAESGVPVYGLTNWSAETFHLALECCPVLTEFEGIVVSGAERVTKPNAAIYRTLLDRFDLDPQRLLFIDDSARNVRAAEDLGMRGHRYTDARSLRAELVARALLPGDRPGG